MNDPGLRRRRSNNLGERLSNLESELLTDTLVSFRRISLDVTIAKIADLTAGTVRIVGPTGSDYILIDATHIHAWIESSNYPDGGFRLSSTGEVFINNDLKLGGGGDDPVQLDMRGDRFGNYNVRVRWDASLITHWDLYTKGRSYGSKQRAFAIAYYDGATVTEHIELVPQQTINDSFPLWTVTINAGTRVFDEGWNPGLNARIETYNATSDPDPPPTFTVDGTVYTVTSVAYRKVASSSIPANTVYISLNPDTPRALNELNDLKGTWQFEIDDTIFLGSDAEFLRDSQDIIWRNIAASPFTPGTDQELKIVSEIQTFSEVRAINIPHLTTYPKMIYNNATRVDQPKLFVGPSPPTGTKAVGDIWVDTTP